MWVMDDQNTITTMQGFSRALQFGDGLFETIKVINGQAQLLNLHAQRLERDLGRLGIACPMGSTRTLLTHVLQAMLAKTGLSDGVLKVIISRGDSARGYGYDASIEPKFTAVFDRLPAIDPSIYQQGIKLQQCQTQCAIQPQLAGIKHLNRLENVLAKAELQSGVFEGLMCNYLGQVIEGTMSNVFFELDDILYTPEISLSGVQGVMREQVLKFLSAHKVSCVIAPIAREQLSQFQGAFICNSVLSIVPVKHLAGQTMTITPICQMLLTAAQSGALYE